MATQAYHTPVASRELAPIEGSLNLSELQQAMTKRIQQAADDGMKQLVQLYNQTHSELQTLMKRCLGDDLLKEAAHCIADAGFDGAPDLVLYRRNPPHLWFVEVKSANDRLRSPNDRLCIICASEERVSWRRGRCVHPIEAWAENSAHVFIAKLLVCRLYVLQ